MNSGALIPFLLLAAAASPPQAQRHEVATPWVILPDPKLAGTTVTVAGGELILKQRAVPMRAGRLTDEIVDPAGKFTFSPGAELFSASSDDAVYCIAGAAEKTGFAKWMASGANGQFCLIDGDGDKKFESFFTPVSMISGLPSLSGKTPKNPKLLPKPVGYEALAPTAMTTRYWVGIEYQGKPLLYNRRNFGVSFGSDSSKGALTSWVYTGSTYPASQTLLNAKWTVEALQSDGRIRVRIDQSLPMQPFGVFRSISYHFY